MRKAELKPAFTSSSLMRCANFKLKTYSRIPRALTAPGWLTVCPTSSTIWRFPGDFEAQLAPAAASLSNRHRAAAIRSHGPHCTTLFERHDVRNNLDLPRNAPLSAGLLHLI